MFKNPKILFLDFTKLFFIYYFQTAQSLLFTQFPEQPTHHFPLSYGFLKSLYVCGTTQTNLQELELTHWS